MRSRSISFDAETIRYKITGNVDVTLQYGSASDRAGDMGAEMDQSFPYECTTVAPVSKPITSNKSSQTSMQVDTRSWRGSEDEIDRSLGTPEQAAPTVAA